MPKTDVAPKYREYGGTIYRDGHVVEDSAEIADAIAQLEPNEPVKIGLLHNTMPAFMKKLYAALTEEK